MSDTTDFKNMHQMLRDATTVAITMHIRPDGDAIGSALALRMALFNMGKRAYVFVEGEAPKNFNYIHGWTKIINSINTDDAEASSLTLQDGQCIIEVENNYDLLVILDTGDEHRIGASKRLRDKCSKVLVFDHHLNPTIKADTVVSNPTMSSVGAMLFEFFEKYDIQVTKAMATALYTAVSSDTGCFLFPNTTWYTHYVASELMKIGIDVGDINYRNFRVYDPKTLDGMMKVLEKIQFVNDGKIAITYLDYKLVKKYNFDHDERHRFQRYATDADGVMVSIFLTEMERDEFNISLRANDQVNVADIAKQFGGGGHKNAAGMTAKGRYKVVIKQLLSAVEEALKQFDEATTSKGKQIEVPNC